MKFQHIIEAVYFQPWAITVPGWKTIHSILRPHLAGGALPEIKAADGTDFLGNPLPKMEVTEQGIAIIPVKGPLLQHAGLMEKMCGACSYDDLKADLRSASEMGLTNAILDIDSPGGGCNGNQEACDYILQLREEGMRIEAFSDTCIASAAYNLAAACDGISITRSACAGSVGVIMAILDCSAQFKEAGLKMEIFAVGKFKAAGAEGTTLTDEQRQYFLGLAQSYAVMFKDNVRSNRQVEEASMEGQVFIGADAVTAGLADRLVADLEDVIELMGE